MKRVIPILLLLLLPAFSFADDSRPDRPHWSLELKGGVLFPDIANWSRFYGRSYLGEYGGALAYKPWREVEVGLEGSYARVSGHGVLPQHTASGQVSVGEVTFQRAPLSLFVLLRGVFDEEQWLVPYAGGGYTRLFYRSDVKAGGDKEGSVNGYHLRGGLQFLLDRVEQQAAENLYREYGLHHTYLFVEGRYIHAMADTVNSGSVNLGGTSCLGGFLFEF